MLRWCIYIEKNYLGEIGFLVCKSDIFLFYLYREELFLHVIRNLFFNRRDYVIQFLSRYPFPASWDWSLQIISLIVDVEFCFFCRFCYYCSLDVWWHANLNNCKTIQYFRSIKLRRNRKFYLSVLIIEQDFAKKKLQNLGYKCFQIASLLLTFFQKRSNISEIRKKLLSDIFAVEV